LKWLWSAYPDAPLEDAIEEEECIERVTACWVGYPKRCMDSVSIFSSGHEIRISFTLGSTRARVPVAKALLLIFEREELLYAQRATHEDHEELAFMLNFLELFSIMYCREENYFDQLCRLEESVIAVEKKYARLK
jgi:hypothetical protein